MSYYPLNTFPSNTSVIDIPINLRDEDNVTGLLNSRPVQPISSKCRLSKVDFKVFLIVSVVFVEAIISTFLVKATYGLSNEKNTTMIKYYCDDSSKTSHQMECEKYQKNYNNVLHAQKICLIFMYIFTGLACASFIFAITKKLCDRRN